MFVCGFVYMTEISDVVNGIEYAIICGGYDFFACLF
jgi:hypothetical protein